MDERGKLAFWSIKGGNCLLDSVNDVIAGLELLEEVLLVLLHGCLNHAVGCIGVEVEQGKVLSFAKA